MNADVLEGCCIRLLTLINKSRQNINLHIQLIYIEYRFTLIVLHLITNLKSLNKDLMYSQFVVLSGLGCW